MYQYIIYLNENNLCEWAILQYLPTGGLKQLKHVEINKFDVNAIHRANEEGNILEVGLEYLEVLFELYNSYTLAPEKSTERKLAVELLQKYIKGDNIPRCNLNTKESKYQT